jgi:hypothetical protein
MPAMAEAPSSSKVVPLSVSVTSVLRLVRAAKPAAVILVEVVRKDWSFLKVLTALMPSSVMPEPMSSRLVIEAAPAILSNPCR